MTKPFYHSGLRFECIRCSACCRFNPGYVFLTREDLDRLVRFMNVSEKEFIDAFCRWIPEGEINYLSLQEKKNYDCVFWNQGCTVYQDRPLQCRTYPFWKSLVSSEERWKLEARSCPGIGKGRFWNRKEIEETVHQRLKIPLLTKKEFDRI